MTTTTDIPTFVSHLECGYTGEVLEADTVHGLSPSGKPILVRYDLDGLSSAVTKDDLAERPDGMWRYREFLPVRRSENVVSLGETQTPLISLDRFASRFGSTSILMKDEGRLPTGSFKARGLAVTCDTAPHYFALNETAVGDYRTFAKVFPPLRGEADRRAVVEGLADGTIDIIASDHVPHDQASKRQPFAQAEPGIVGLETLLPLALEPHHQDRISMLDLLAKLTVKPAELLRLPAGRLSKGAAADLALFDPDVPWQIDTGSFRGKSKNAPYDGRPVAGQVLRTVVDGRTVFQRSDDG